MSPTKNIGAKSMYPITLAHSAARAKLAMRQPISNLGSVSGCMRHGIAATAPHMMPCSRGAALPRGALMRRWRAISSSWGDRITTDAAVAAAGRLRRWRTMSARVTAGAGPLETIFLAMLHLECAFCPVTVRFALQRELYQAVNQLRVAHTCGSPKFGIHAYLSKSRNGVELVQP